jgi:CSLREA domain-containing protein
MNVGAVSRLAKGLWPAGQSEAMKGRALAAAVPPLGSTITVNSTDDVTNPSDGKCTLQEAITAANTDTA